MPSSETKRPAASRWRTAALRSAALLVVPIAVWLALPSRAPAPASAPSRAAAPPPAEEPQRPARTAARPVPLPPAEAPRAVEPAPVEEAGSKDQTGIAGNVFDATGSPVMTFSIGVASFVPAGGGDGGAGGAARRDVDDVAGAFELTDLAPGRYELVVSPSGGALSRSQPIEVTPGAMTRGVRIALQPAVAVTGMVTDARTHAPLDGARAWVSMGGVTSDRPWTRAGEFTILDAPATRFDLTVTRAGYMPKVVRGLEGRPGGKPLHVDVALDPIGAP